MFFKLQDDHFILCGGADTPPLDTCETSLSQYHTSRNFIDKPLCAVEEGETTIGIELELEFPTDLPNEQLISTVEHAFANVGISDDKFHIERDGSLNNGFEAVLSYGGLGGYKIVMEKLLADNIFSKVRFKYAGLHINVGSPRLSYLHDINFFALAHMLVCSEVRQNTLLKLLFGRCGLRHAENNYCRMLTRSEITNAVNREDYQGLTSSRVAFNGRGSNSKFFEWRIFAPTVNSVEMKERLELADCMTNFCLDFAPHSGKFYDNHMEQEYVEISDDNALCRRAGLVEELRKLREKEALYNLSDTFVAFLNEVPIHNLWGKVADYAKEHRQRYPNLLSITEFVNLS